MKSTKVTNVISLSSMYQFFHFRIHNNNNPQWTTTFDLEYEYGSESFFHVQVFRFVNSNDKPISLGSAVYEVGDILGTHTNTKVKRLPRGGA